MRPRNLRRGGGFEFVMCLMLAGFDALMRELVGKSPVVPTALASQHNPRGSPLLPVLGHRPEALPRLLEVVLLGDDGALAAAGHGLGDDGVGGGVADGVKPVAGWWVGSVGFGKVGCGWSF
jgi:hypothetical protein